jgi:hypothetical protein
MPIFWRLVSGYTAILLLSAGVSLHYVGELGALSARARSALESDSRRITILETLTDAFLSEARYAGKYVISHTREHYEQYLQFNNDFGRYLKDLHGLRQSADSKTRLNRIGDLHVRYNDLFQREVAYTASSQMYGESRYRQEKEKILESALRELELFRAYAQKNLQAELGQMGNAANAARRRAIITTLALLGIGFGLCYAISRSITTPLLALQDDDVREVSAPAPSSPTGRIPEIRALAEKLRLAKARARDANQSRAVFVHMVSNEFATPLLSLKNRLYAFRSTLGEHATAEQKSALAVMSDETERLIQACVRVQSKAPAELTRSEPQQGAQAEAVSTTRTL